jgi:rhodanese-related sulfurtransferase
MSLTLTSFLEHRSRANSTGSAAPSRSPSPAPTDKKVQEVSQSKIGDVATGISRSRVLPNLTTIGTTAVVIIAALLILKLAFFLTNPVGWAFAALVLSTFVIAFIVGVVAKKGTQKMSFEISAIIRMMKKENFQRIAEDPKNPKKVTRAQIFLGALPNKLTGDGKKLQKEKIGAVISLNEIWETSPVGLSIPYSKKDWQEMKIQHEYVKALDHKLLSVEQLDAAADKINQHIQAGRNVYVHCRAGVGRSAQAVAAYLIKYEGKSVDDACDIIVSSRKVATVKKKKDALNAFAVHCQAHALKHEHLSKLSASFAESSAPVALTA